MRPIGMTLSALRNASNLSQNDVAKWLSAKYKPTKARAVSDWERGKGMPNAEHFLYLCQLYHVDNVQVIFAGKESGLNDLGIRKLQEYATLLEESERYANKPKPESARVLRLFSLPVSAGTGSFMEDDHFEWIEADDTVPFSADFAVPVSGDSMYPRFADRQIVWVHKQASIENGEIGIFGYNGNAYIKRFDSNHSIPLLISINPIYKPIRIVDTDSFIIFGKIVG
jgi:SOS-response transcriptional repressor LexA